MDFKSSKQITEKINLIYEMCRFESAWYYDEPSPWCFSLRKEDLKIFEYREDLNYYYCCGPGQEIASKMGCLYLNNMFNHFE